MSPRSRQYKPITGLESLTKSERVVLNLVVDLKTNREIARKLFVTESAIRFHLRMTYGKLFVSGHKGEIRIKLIRSAKKLFKEESNGLSA